MPQEDNIAWATIGKVVAPFGIRGELKVLLLTDIPNRFSQLEAVHVGPTHTLYTISAVRPYRGEMVILKLAQINDATAAETLRNFALSIPLSQLAQLPPDSYYFHDILGLNVSTLDGHQLGPIVDIMVTGSNDVYIIQTPNGKQLLIPAIKDVIKQVDLIRKMMYIDPIRGLLDDDEALNAEREEE